MHCTFIAHTFLFTSPTFYFLVWRRLLADVAKAEQIHLIAGGEDGFILNSNSKIQSDELSDADSDEWLNPWAARNRGIFASYLAVGFGIYFIQTPLVYYMASDKSEGGLGATAAQQSVVMGLLSLPWAMKVSII